MPLSPAALEPLLLLALVEGIGPHRLARLSGHFGSAERVLAAPAREVAAVEGVGPRVAQRVREATGSSGQERLRRGLALLHRVGGVGLTPDDLAFPDAFRALPDPPYLLFAAGDLSLLAEPGVAVVGTRDPSAYGRQTAVSLSRELALAGLAIVSGMARGIDTAAHTAALDAGGGTVGVLGHGVDQVYPPESRALFQRVRGQGLLVTEYPPGETPKAGNFPRRNRLIAALGEAVLVVEMGLKSGAQHTVGYALELGKDVLAVPGPIDSPRSAGTNQLIREGARLVTSANDVLEEIRGVSRAPRLEERVQTHGAGAPVAAPPELPLLSPDEQRALTALAPEPRHVDELSGKAGLPSGALLASLLALEMRGLVEALPGKRYRRT